MYLIFIVAFAFSVGFIFGSIFSFAMYSKACDKCKIKKRGGI